MRRLALAILASTILASPALAQSQTPVFRVPLSQSSPTTSLPSVYMWSENVGSCSTTCGTGTRTTSYQCQDAAQPDVVAGGYGPAEADAQCIANVGAKPTDSTTTCSNYSGCTFDWVKPAEVVTPVSGRVGCGQVRRQFNPQCRRTDGTVMASGDYTLCRNDLPDYNDVAAGVPGALGYDRTVTETDQCVNSWNTGAWSGWSSTCSATATRTRSVVCKAELDGSVLPDASCPGPKPATSETAAEYSGCGYAWNTGAWSAWSSTCSATATQTRTVTCLRSDGTTVADANCAGPKPATSQSGAVYTGCSYAWQTGAWSAWDSTCSATATQTRTVTCQRSDGTTVADANCAGPKPATSQTSAQYGSCSYGWLTGGWGPSSSTCSATATQTRSVTCQRSDGTIVADASCPGPKPATSQTLADYSGCGYAWVTGGWGPSSSTCSSSATQTRSVFCQRSDGATVADASCPGPKPATSQPVADYSGCTYGTTYGSWSACASNTQSRSITCTRSDGVQVATSYCGFAGSPTTESQGCVSCATYKSGSLQIWGYTGASWVWKNSNSYPFIPFTGYGAGSATKQGVRAQVTFTAPDGSTGTVDTGNYLCPGPSASCSVTASGVIGGITYQVQAQVNYISGIWIGVNSYANGVQLNQTNSCP